MVFEPGDIVFISAEYVSLVRPIGVVERLNHFPGNYVIRVDTIFGEDLYNFYDSELMPINKFFKRLYGID